MYRNSRRVAAHHLAFAAAVLALAAFVMLPALVFAQTVTNSNPEGFPNFMGRPATPVIGVDSSGNYSATGATTIHSITAESSHVLKASPGNLYDLQITTGATAGYLLLFDATSAPADGAVTPTKCFGQIAANSTLGLSWTSGPAATFQTGIVAVFSSTGCFTKTASATAYFSGEVK